MSETGSAGVEIDAEKTVEKRMASEVFLALVWEVSDNDNMTFPHFRELVETYMRIRDMERRIRTAELEESLNSFWKNQPATVLVAPEPVPEEPAHEKKEKNQKRVESGKESFARRKADVLSRIEAFRESGGTMQDIADAGRGLTLTIVLDAISAKPLPVNVWAALEKAMTALEKRGAMAREEAHPVDRNE